MYEGCVYTHVYTKIDNYSLNILQHIYSDRLPRANTVH